MKHERAQGAPPATRTACSPASPAPAPTPSRSSSASRRSSSSVNGNLRRAAVELAKDWRTDRMLRRLEALLVVADRESLAHRVGHRRRHRARGRHRRDRLGRQLRARRGARARAATRRSTRAAIVEEAHAHRRRDLHLHERPARRSRSSRRVSAMATFTPREIVSELDRYIVGQRAAKRAVAIALRNRWRRHAGAGAAARRDRAEEHHHDRPDRRREDGDLAPARQARAGARSSRSRRRSSPRSATSAATSSRSSATSPSSRSTWCARRRSEKVRVRARELAEERLLDLLLPPPPDDVGCRSAERPSHSEHAREAAPHAARGQARRARWSRSR